MMPVVLLLPLGSIVESTGNVSGQKLEFKSKGYESSFWIFVMTVGACGE